ncbi:DUF3460 family protein [Corticibacter populi]|uniref:DUF3460 family protein n=1 Tax=Corticibacter populi TaxID=1550736 RepID=A0A3M6QL03_9BURK|nr:DUF3460 family protein [Corticibacter populi]RMX03625.1 DUF3460 family protein [Corticibacter populi]
MSFFQRPHYQSEATRFIAQLKHQKPSLDAEQQAGRKLLWDKNVDARIWQEYRAGEVPQKPYVYQTNPDAEA